MIAVLAGLSVCAQTQFFRTKDRMDRLEGFDERKFSYGFYLSGHHYDYKIVLDPVYGMNGKQNLVQQKGSAGFGAGLIGRMRINDDFDLRLEPGLQFVQRDLTFNTQVNDRFSAGTTLYEPFTPIVMTEADQHRTIKSTYIDVPLLLELHGNRWYNSRPYVASGVNYMVNLQSNQGATDDNRIGIYRSTTHNFGWSVEAGIQFYFSRFKLTPAFRGTFVTNNEIVRDNQGTPPYWTAAMATAQSRAFLFVLKFE
ncbi:porin family protein [Bergeyella sp. RCAD1439]|nr:porin family protein [Bergeyella sp. RCAD1439]